ncbi:hypothetical protein [Nocardiopsis lambiniae]|uniref:Uncharacterized protein n=1 Tax=Nocardiopsis lambiniae TaxID=3075539 RepID=A0ABU2MIM4_9ACTN|nr:hypothetical protein [Nocardiopsis sp. DSM 44743]MDT0331925.1 hypothetical protein [Nocardiopsis sp. DSM 44743]
MPDPVIASDPESPDTPAPRARPNPWPARVALIAAAGLVVGGVAYAGVEIADAFTPATTSPDVSAAETARDPGERRTTSLIADPAEETAQETATDPAPGGEAEPPAGGGGTNGASADGTVPTGTTNGGTGEDPRKEILHGILTTPQERPPLHNPCDQACVDAERERLEADVEPVVVEFDIEDH